MGREEPVLLIETQHLLLLTDSGPESDQGATNGKLKKCGVSVDVNTMFSLLFFSFFPCSCRIGDTHDWGKGLQARTMYYLVVSNTRRSDASFRLRTPGLSFR